MCLLNVEWTLERIIEASLFATMRYINWHLHLHLGPLNCFCIVRLYGTVLICTVKNDCFIMFAKNFHPSNKSRFSVGLRVSDICRKPLLCVYITGGSTVVLLKNEAITHQAVTVSDQFWQQLVHIATDFKLGFFSYKLATHFAFHNKVSMDASCRDHHNCNLHQRFS